MAEQRDFYRFYRVIIHCDRCAQRRGRGPVLAVADRTLRCPILALAARQPRCPEGWRIWRLRVARRLARRLPPHWQPVATSYSGGAVPDQPKRVALERGRRLVLVPLHPLEASAAQLICRDCKARPRVSQAKLIELAEQAEAASRHDAYA